MNGESQLLALASLVIEEGDRAGQSCVLSDSTRIGRDEICEMVLPDDSVSKLHAVITRLWRWYHLRDQGSANGVIVNGRRVAQARLRHGDEIRLGSVRLRVVLAHPSPAIWPPPVIWRQVGPELALIVLIAALGWVIASFASTPPALKKLEEAPDLGYRLRLPGHWRQLYRQETASLFPGALHTITVYGGPYPQGQAVFAMDVLTGLPETTNLAEAVILGKTIGQFLYHPDGVVSERQVVLAGTEGREVVTEFDAPRGRLTTRVIYLLHDGHRVALIAAAPTAWYTTVRPVFDEIMKGVELAPPVRSGLLGSGAARTLIEAREWLRLGERYSREHRVAAANLHEGILWYRKAIERFRQVDPTLPEAATARQGLRTAEEALETRFRELAFEAERALRLGDQRTASLAASLLLTLVPNPDDERYRMAKRLYDQSAQ